MTFPLFTRVYRPLLLALPLLANSSQFHYDDAEMWPLHHPLCGGQNQSPIAINVTETLPVNFSPLVFGHYHEVFAEPVELRNNGHSIGFKIPPTISHRRPFITGGGLWDEVYDIQDAHFHWGASFQQKGSEHTLNGRRYDVELHLVHKNRKYESMAEAVQHKDGVAVLSVLFKYVLAEYSTSADRSAIYAALPQLYNYNSTILVNKQLSLDGLLQNLDRNFFYTYQGSLTTPPCSEAVTWHVFPTPIPIPYTQLWKFWTIRDSRQLPLVNNYRPTQPLGKRTIHRQELDYPVFVNTL